MLGLKIDPPMYWELELLTISDGLFQQSNGFGIIHALEARVRHLFEPSNAVGIDVLPKEVELLGTVRQYPGEDELQELFCQGRVVRQIREGYLGLDHPEFREVSRRVRVLSAKCGAKSVNARQRTTVRFKFELARDGQECLAPKEVLGRVNRTIRQFG